MQENKQETISEDTQKMPHSRSTALKRRQNAERKVSNNDRPNATYESTGMQTKKISATEIFFFFFFFPLQQTGTVAQW